MLHLYRRHLKTCPHTSMSDRRCQCPIWAHGKVDGRKFRKSLETRNWDAAARIVRDWEVSGKEKGAILIDEALSKFIEDCKSNGIGAAQLGKYELMKKELEDHFRGRPLDSITADNLAEIRKEWESFSSATRRGKLGRWRRFFTFCEVERGWIQKNPARLLKPPKEKMRQVEPFSREDMERIFWAVELYPDKPKGRRKQLKALLLLLRYTGLRIGDALQIRPENIVNNKVSLTTTKTGSAVLIPLPKSVCSEIQEVVNGAGFWSRSGNVKSCVADWQRTLKKLLAIAGVQGHFHQFRHFMACDLLSHGASVENVAAILGNTPPMVMKHYAKFVKERQIALEREVEKIWAGAN